MATVRKTWVNPIPQPHITPKMRVGLAPSTTATTTPAPTPTSGLVCPRE